MRENVAAQYERQKFKARSGDMKHQLKEIYRGEMQEIRGL
jgi:hypothetical protein